MTYGLKLSRVIKIKKKCKRKKIILISNHDDEFANILNAFWLTAITFVSTYVFDSHFKFAIAIRRIRLWQLNYVIKTNYTVIENTFFCVS